MPDSLRIPLLTPTEYRDGVSDRLKRLLDMLELSHTEAAKIMGMSRSALQHALPPASRNFIPAYHLYRLAYAKRINPFEYVFLGDYSGLPHRLARKIEAGLQPGPEPSTELAPTAAGERLGEAESAD